MSAVLTPTMTPDDLLKLPDEGRGFELVRGKLKALNGSILSTFVAGQVYFHLQSHIGPKRPGWVSPEGTSFRCFPFDENHVRRADVAFHRLDRITAEQARTEGHCVVVPDLAVEVVSPNDLASEVNEKCVEWLEAGAKLVWLIYPVHQEIHAYRADGTVALIRRADVLTAEPVLPDFRVPAGDLFRLPAERN